MNDRRSRFPAGDTPECADVRDSLSAYADDELPPRRAAEVAEHVQSCEHCGRDLEALRRTGVLVRHVLQPPPTPDVLRARVRTAIRAAESDAAGGAGAGAARSSGNRGRGHWARLVAAGLVVAAVSSLTTVAIVRPRSPEASAGVAHEAVQSHVRALMSARTIDVASTDQHTVKPWFNGRVDFSPDVPRLDSLGFPLLGGRVDDLGNRPVAAIVYGRRKHVIDVFTRPVTDASRAASDTAVVTERGYHVLHWAAGGMEYWAVSDVAVADLREFAADFARYADSGSESGPSSRR